MLTTSLSIYYAYTADGYYAPECARSHFMTANVQRLRVQHDFAAASKDKAFAIRKFIVLNDPRPFDSLSQEDSMPRQSSGRGNILELIGFQFPCSLVCLFGRIEALIWRIKQHSDSIPTCLVIVVTLLIHN